MELIMPNINTKIYSASRAEGFIGQETYDFHPILPLQHQDAVLLSQRYPFREAQVASGGRGCEFHTAEALRIGRGWPFPERREAIRGIGSPLRRAVISVKSKRLQLFDEKVRILRSIWPFWDEKVHISRSKLLFWDEKVHISRSRLLFWDEKVRILRSIWPFRDEKVHILCSKWHSRHAGVQIMRTDLCFAVHSNPCKNTAFIINE